MGRPWALKVISVERYPRSTISLTRSVFGNPCNRACEDQGVACCLSEGKLCRNCNACVFHLGCCSPSSGIDLPGFRFTCKRGSSITGSGKKWRWKIVYLHMSYVVSWLLSYWRCVTTRDCRLSNWKVSKVPCHVIVRYDKNHKSYLYNDII